MPRQLPWLNKGATAKSKRFSTSSTPKTTRKPSKIPDDHDDDGYDSFFDGTILESSNKAKGEARSSPLPESDKDDFADLPTTSSISYGHSKNASETLVDREDRVSWSSPPPQLADSTLPEIEYMRKARSRFDLRDDEWMMVEDELLRTANLFTKQVKAQDYQEIKEKLQRHRQVVRPVVPDAKPSFESRMKTKAEEHLRKQKQALREARADGWDDDKPPKLESRKVSAKLKPCAPISAKTDASKASDSDDLDGSNWSSRAASSSRSKSASTIESFVKPALPATSEKRTTRPVRKTAFDFLDDEPLPPPNASAQFLPPNTSTQKPPISFVNDTPPARSASPWKPPAHYGAQIRSSPSTQPISAQSQSTLTRASQRASRHFDPFSELDLPQQDLLPKDQVKRQTKRKAERSKEEIEAKKKTVNLDEIPTFLF